MITKVESCSTELAIPYLLTIRFAQAAENLKIEVLKFSLTVNRSER